MKLYYLNVCEVPSFRFKEWFDEARPEKQKEILQIKIDSKRKTKIAADRLCKTAVSEFCNISPDKIIIKKNEFGKPFADRLPVHFNISHSGDFVVCAVSEKEIGIDIEKIRPIRPDVAKKFATEEELGYIGTNLERFFDIWTLKEAYFKCIGTGLGTDIKKISFRQKNGLYFCSDNCVTLTRLDAPNGYIGFVCEKN